MNRVIEIVVSAKGETTLQTKGFLGASCLEASRLLEKALGTPIAEQRTAEYFEIAQEEERQHT